MENIKSNATIANRARIAQNKQQKHAGLTLAQINEKIKECERQGIFDCHIYPADFDGNFAPFTWRLNKFIARTKVYGRKHLKGLKKAIVTCNHVFMYDYMVAKLGLKGRNVMVNELDFNNYKEYLGGMMSSSGMQPINAGQNNEEIENHLNKNRFVLFYPEQTIWHMYDKPRPFQDDAFQFAVKFNVPVLPMFITYRESGKTDKEGFPIKYFTLNIMPPIYPREGLTEKQNIEYLKEVNYNLCVTKYRQVYGHMPTYNS